MLRSYFRMAAPKGENEARQRKAMEIGYRPARAQETGKGKRVASVSQVSRAICLVNAHYKDQGETTLRR